MRSECGARSVKAQVVQSAFRELLVTEAAVAAEHENRVLVLRVQLHFDSLSRMHLDVSAQQF
jgi:hypothetical protein